MVGSQAKRGAVAFLIRKYSLSERKACELSKMARSTCRYKSAEEKDGELKKHLKELAYKRKSFGYRRLHVLLKRGGFVVNHKKVYRIYREAESHEA